MVLVHRAIVVVLAKADEALDLVLYRPAVVRLFLWVPAWWSCNLARLAVRLDDGWNTGYWDDGPVPGEPCEACHRRASIYVLGGLAEGEEAGPCFLDTRPVLLCGWCRISSDEFPICDEEHLRRASRERERHPSPGRGAIQTSGRAGWVSKGR